MAATAARYDTIRYDTISGYQILFPTYRYNLCMTRLRAFHASWRLDYDPARLSALCSTTAPLHRKGSCSVTPFARHGALRLDRMTTRFTNHNEGTRRATLLRKPPSTPHLEGRERSAAPARRFFCSAPRVASQRTGARGRHCRRRAAGSEIWARKMIHGLLTRGLHAPLVQWAHVTRVTPQLVKFFSSAKDPVPYSELSIGEGTHPPSMLGLLAGPSGGPDRSVARDHQLRGTVMAGSGRWGEVGCMTRSAQEYELGRRRNGAETFKSCSSQRSGS